MIPCWFPSGAAPRFTLVAAPGGSLVLEADRRTLIRRVTLNLTGLPPAPEEVEAFLSDTAPDAYERSNQRDGFRVLREAVKK